jgi:hypothetical protein
MNKKINREMKRLNLLYKKCIQDSEEVVVGEEQLKSSSVDLLDHKS